MDIEKIKDHTESIWTLLTEQKPKTSAERQALNSLLSKLSLFEEDIDTFNQSPISDFTKESGNINQKAIGSHINQQAKINNK